MNLDINVISLWMFTMKVHLVDYMYFQHLLFIIECILGNLSLRLKTLFFHPNLTLRPPVAVEISTPLL